MSKRERAPIGPAGSDPLHIYDPMQFSAGDLTLLAQALRARFRMPDSDSADPVLSLQLRYSIALCQIANFFRQSGVGDDIAGRFEQLGSAMFDLQYGTTHPLLRATKFGEGRRLDSTDVSYLRDMAALGVECLLASGMGRDEAADHVIRQYPAISRLARPGANAKTSLLSWRDTLLKPGKAKPHPTRNPNLYEENRLFFEHASPEQLRAQAAKALAGAAEKAARIIPADWP